MVFNDTAGGTGVIQEVERITGLGQGGITGNGVLFLDFTARINNAKDRFFALAFEFDELWSFDDRNYADTGLTLPIGWTNIVSGQRDYLFSAELLALEQVFVKDSNGVFYEIFPQDDRNEPRAYDLTNTGGRVSAYELVGNSIILDTAPAYNSTAGLKVVYKRNGTKFTTSDGGVAIGIPSLFHPYLAREASQPYLDEKNKSNKVSNQNKIYQDEEALKKFISNRAKPKRLRLTVKNEDTR